MSTESLLADLLTAGVQLWAEGDELRFRAPRGALEGELRRRLIKGKGDVVTWLGQGRKHAVCSFSQQRLWFLEELAPGTAAYGMPDAVRLSGELDVAALAGSFARIVQRHEILRTRFRSLAGRPVQVVSFAAQVALPCVDLSALPSRHAEREQLRLINREALRPFDLARGPLLRLVLFRLAAGEHVLLVNLHHIVSDGWSQGVLFRELAALYAAVDARTDPRPALPLQYADHAVRQRRRLSGDLLSRQLAYWRGQLDRLAPVGLPTDRTRPARQSHRGAMLPVLLPSELTSRLHGLSRDTGASLFMTLLAAFMTLVHRLTGASDVAVGSPIAHRTRAELEGLIGFFVNTLVMRGDLSSAPTVHELLARVREHALAAYSHQDLPFEKLVEELQPRRDMSRNPFFQLTFALQNAPRTRIELPGLTLDRVEFDRHAVRLDLELYLWEVPPANGGAPQLGGKIFYNADLFDATTVRRLARRHQLLLEEMVARPDRRIGDLRLLTPPERHQLLREQSSPAVPDPWIAAHQLFERRAAARPDAPALIRETPDGPEVWTYGGLDRRTNQLARLLCRRGVGPEVLVAVYLERSVEAALAIVAALKAGGAFLPLDPANPTRRLSRMLAGLGTDQLAPVVLTRSGLERAAATLVPRAAVLPLDRLADALVSEPSGPLAIPVDPRGLAYAIFTSGSTGCPKGSALSHAGLANLMLHYAERFRLRPHHRASLVAASGFDASVWELWSHLGAGASLHLPPPEVELFPNRLAAWLECRRISHCFLPTPLMDALLASPALCQRSPPTLESLQAGGDRLRNRPAAGSGFELLNLYGPSEATVVTVYGRVAAAPPAGAGERPIPIGRPVGGCQALVLDPGLAPAPLGAPGELHLAGVAVMRGYLGSPAATAEKIVPHPWAEAPGERLYKTADLARQRADAVIECLGRVDRQLKIRGLRIEPAEIEALLRADPGVADAAVVPVPATGGDRRLAAFFVPETEPVGSAHEENRSAERVERWRALYDELYADRTTDDPRFDVVGWNDSVTGRPIPATEMREWVDATVRRIRRLEPGRVLEIGCGTGLLLWRLAPLTRHYLATDFSRPVIDALAAQLAQPGRELPRVELQRRAADDFAALPACAFDTVVLSSVVQYFPSAGYLLRVLRGAVDTLDDGGRAFLGDVRSLPLLPAFCAAVELGRSAPDRPVAEIRAGALDRRAREPELVIDPAFFDALRFELPRLAEVRVQPKLAHARNELSCFRYDVTLFLDRPATRGPLADSRVWPGGATGLKLVRQRLQAAPDAVEWRDIPDPRVARALRLAELLDAPGGLATAGDLELRLDQLPDPGPEPTELAALGHELGYEMVLSCPPGARPGRFSASFHRPGSLAAPAATVSRPRSRVASGERRPWRNYMTDPLAARADRRPALDLRDRLRRQLPATMIPAVFVELDRLPSTPNGKVDYPALARLPLADATPGAGTSQEVTPPASAPLNGDQELLSAIWEEVLGLAEIHPDDSFFDLGGHSLLATQVVSRIRQTWGIELPLRRLFEHPTLRDLAVVVTRLRQARHREAEEAKLSPPPPLEAAPRPDEVPLSFAQQRLWFLSRLDSEHSPYPMAVAFRLEGRLDRQALELALGRIVERHETLRTVFPSRDGRPQQRILPHLEVSLPLIDLSALEPGHRAATESAIARASRGRSFDLATGPLFRVALARLSAREHLLLIEQHHVVSDGWSMSILYRELSTLYDNFAAGRTPSLPELPVQYADFALWQRAWLRGPALASRLAFWRRQLADCRPLELPTDRPRPSVPTYRAACHPIALPEELVSRLRRQSLDTGASLFMTLVAAYATLLGRLAGQDDVVLGSPTAGRGLRQLENLIGFFVNSLVLRVHLKGEASFESLTQQVRETALEAYAHQDLPFEKLVEELRPSRDASRNPLFQVWLALQNAPRSRVELRGLALTRLADEPERVRFDFELHLWKADDGLRGWWLYSTDLFDPSTIGRWAHHLGVLLRAAAADPRRGLSRLPLLSRCERHQLTREWNDTRGADLRLGRLDELCRQRARAGPDAIAVTLDATAGDSACLSFGRLDAEAAGLAERLRRLGAGPESVVGVAVERSLEMVVALLAVLQSGAAYLPLDPSYPRRRLRFMLRDSGIRVVLVQEHLTAARALADDASVETVVLEQAPGEPPPVRHDPAAPQPALDRAAYVIYTSGSTGRPKAVVNSHRSIVRHLLWMQDTFQLDASDTVAQKTPLSFDVSVWEVFWPLITGSRLALAAPDGHRDLGYLAEHLVRQRVTTVHFVPPVLAAFLARPEGIFWPSARRVIASGEALPRSLAERAKTQLPCPLYNLYGPTEAAIDVTWHRFGGRGYHDSVAIGRPVADTAAHVVDERGELTPHGVPGELVLAGLQLARGYRRRPALTAERFVPDPLGGGPGGRLYRTGDRVRRRGDGALEFLDRLDAQIKVRGVRIEPAEIEETLRRHPEVLDAAVVLQPPAQGDAGEPRLAAFLAPRAGTRWHRQEILEGSRDQTSRWRDVYDDLYGRDAGRSRELDLVGWDSSYTGEPIPEAEMREWVERAVSRILATAPRRVLEIGCGTGLILERLARHCEVALGTDFSRQAIDDLGTRLAALGGLSHVHLEQRTAGDFVGIAPGSFDTVVLNSVVQYFPGTDYLVEVLQGAARATAEGGAIFVGDVRSLPLLDAFCASVERHRAPPTETLAELAELTGQRRAQERELVIAPDFFQQLTAVLPRLAGALVEPKGGHHHNELTCFRYDVTLWLDRLRPAPGTAPEIPWLDWPLTGWTLPDLRRELAERRPAPIGLRRVANARLTSINRLLRAFAEADPRRSVETLAPGLTEPDARAIDPAELEELAGPLGYQVRLSWSGSPADGAYDALFFDPADTPAAVAALGKLDGAHRPAGPLANNPLRERLARRLAPVVREHARRRLPESHLPDAYVVLDALPRTPSGKVDRGALRRRPLASSGRGDRRAVAPRDDVEEILATIWRRLLGRDQVGVHDDFFELGGHSLLATQVTSRLRQVFGVEIPVRQLFERPTISQLAAGLLAEKSGAAGPDAAPIERVSRRAPLPLSFAQQRLWLLAQLQPHSVAYHMPAVFRLRGPLSTAALRASLREIVRRHEILRTVFASEAGRPRQVVLPTERSVFRLSILDLSGLAPCHRSREAARRLRDEARRPFDLGRGPLFRGCLLKLADRHHLLSLCQHHVVSDGWSQGVFHREWSALYSAFRRGQPSPLPELTLQYADFAAWQRRWVSGERLANQLDFWRKQLRDPPAALDLPVDRHRPKIQGDRGDRCRLAIPAPAAAELEQAARRAGASLYMTLLTTFAIFLHRVTGQRDLTIGAPIANRHRREIEDLIGFFVNTLVMRVDLTGRPSFLGVLERVREVALAGYAHQDLPFERLVEELQPERDLSRPPLFQVMLTLHNTPAVRPRLDGLSVEPIASGIYPAKLDLELSLGTGDHGLEGVLAFDADLFDATTVRRLTDAFVRLAAGAARDGDARIDELPLLSPAERHALLVEWNDTARELDGELRLHRLFARQAGRRPDAVALISDGRRWTYGELALSVRQLAERLTELGIGVEDRVAVCLPRSADTVICALAVLETGAAFVPLDPEHPVERLAGLLRESRAAGWITLERLFSAGDRRTLEAATEWTLRLDDAGLSPDARRPAGRRHLAPFPGQAAYVMFTSGSSGRPKGVVGTHRATINRLRWMWEAAPFADGDAACHKTPPTFVDSVWEIFGPLLAGVPTVVVPARDVPDPRALIAALSRERVSRLVLVPSLLRVVLDTLAEDGSTLPHLGLWAVSGEALSDDLARRFAELAPAARLLNLYGSTEVAADVTWQPISPGRPVAIGRPIANARTYVVDRRAQPAGVSVSGELLVAGDGLARGYLDRPRLTAEAFRPDALSARPGARLYRTGDRARWLPDGRLAYQGRLDRQIQLRGVRIEPGEIATVLASHPAVADAAVVLSGDGQTGHLVAYFEPATEGTPVTATAPAASGLRDFLKARLPAVMVPARIVALSALPRTTSGKIDPRELLRRASEGDFPAQEPGPDHPSSTPGSATLAAIWCEILGVSEVSEDDGFFELGGHSLLATRVVSRIRRAFGLTSSLRLLFENPTLGEQARALERLRRTQLTEAAGTLLSTQLTEAAGTRLTEAAGTQLTAGYAGPGGQPLSFAQRRLWFLSHLEPEAPWYNLPVPLRLAGDLEPGWVRAALTELVRRHGTLRTRFTQRDGRPIQEVGAAFSPPLPLVDLSGLAEPERDAEAGRLGRSQLERPFDLEGAPPWRAILVRLESRRHLLLAALHHILADGWSIQIFQHELAILCEALASGRPFPLPPLPVQYIDFARWQRDRLAGTALAPHLAYWRARLADAPPALELPMDRPRPELQRHAGGAASWRLPAGTARALRSLCRDEGASPFMVLLAGFTTWIHRVTGRRDVVVGTPIAGRAHEAIESLIGCFFNTLALRQSLSPGDSFLQLLRSVRSHTLDAFAFSELPFEKLVEELRPDRALSRHPLFQISLALQNVPRATTPRGDLEVRALPAGSHTVRLDLELYLWEQDETFAGHLLYDLALFDDTTAARMARQLETLTVEALADPSRQLRDLRLTSPAQRHQLLVEWSRALPTDSPAEVRDPTIPRLVERWIQTTPDRVAVVWEPRPGVSESMSYRWLDQLGDCLAHRLRTRGVGAESRVALLVERTPDMIVGVLGTWKVGAAYLPLDPAAPVERQRRILRDAEVAVLVTRGDLAAAATDLPVPIVELGGAEPEAARAPRRDARPEDPDPDHLAYVVHTSGSTGRPKGVMISHRSLLGAFRAWGGPYRLLPGPRRHLQMASLAFDVFTGDLARALGAGGTLVICPRETLVDPSELRSAIERQRVDCAEFVPAVALALARRPRRRRGRLVGLRHLIVGSDHWTRRDLAELAGTVAPETHLVSSYGVTEATIDSSFQLLALPPRSGAEPVPIGRPFAGTELRVLDLNLRPLPLGVPGELGIAGPGLARGYLDRPAATAERFVPHPNGEPGARLYRTGDLARHLPDGNLELRGRIDRQLKVRGLRVEPAEIEAALEQYPGVGSAAVVLHAGDATGTAEAPRLVAFFTARSGGEPPRARELHAALARALPLPMVPSVYAVLEALPRTTSGKIDRRVLERRPLPAGHGASPVSDSPPRNTTEQALAEVWADVLGVEEVSIDDGFFDLGGHSLLAIRLMDGIERRLGVRLTMLSLFSGATIRQQAEEVSREQPGHRALPANPPPNPSLESPPSPRPAPQGRPHSPPEEDHAL